MSRPGGASKHQKVLYSKKEQELRIKLHTTWTRPLTLEGVHKLIEASVEKYRQMTTG
jgi:hypothetical protein